MRYPYNGKNINIPDSYIENAKHTLGLSLNEAVEMYLSDEGIVKDPTVEEMTAKAKTAGAGAKATGEKVVRKAPERKPDEVKRALIAAMNDFIASQDGVSGVEVTNVERMIAFEFAGDKYEVTLTKKRKPKE